VQRNQPRVATPEGPVVVRRELSAAHDEIPTPSVAFRRYLSCEVMGRLRSADFEITSDPTFWLRFGRAAIQQEAVGAHVRVPPGVNIGRQSRHAASRKRSGCSLDLRNVSDNRVT